MAYKGRSSVSRKCAHASMFGAWNYYFLYGKLFKFRRGTESSSVGSIIVRSKVAMLRFGIKMRDDALSCE